MVTPNSTFICYFQQFLFGAYTHNTHYVFFALSKIGQAKIELLFTPANIYAHLEGYRSKSYGAIGEFRYSTSSGLFEDVKNHHMGSSALYAQFDCMRKYGPQVTIKKYQLPIYMQLFLKEFYQLYHKHECAFV